MKNPKKEGSQATSRRLIKKKEKKKKKKHAVVPLQLSISELVYQICRPFSQWQTLDSLRYKLFVEKNG
jgi:tRNA splicing endonuclease